MILSLWRLYACQTHPNICSILRLEIHGISPNLLKYHHEKLLLQTFRTTCNSNVAYSRPLHIVRNVPVGCWETFSCWDYSSFSRNYFPPARGLSCPSKGIWYSQALASDPSVSAVIAVSALIAFPPVRNGNYAFLSALLWSPSLLSANPIGVSWS